MNANTAPLTPASDLPNAGDLARVAECCGCEGSRQNLGEFVLVTAIEPPINAICVYCLTSFAIVGALTSDGRRFNRAFLRRVPPLSDLQSIDICTELDAERSRDKVAA